MKTRAEAVAELAEFLTDLPVQRLTAMAIAMRLYDGGWRRSGSRIVTPADDQAGE